MKKIQKAQWCYHILLNKFVVEVVVVTMVTKEAMTLLQEMVGNKPCKNPNSMSTQAIRAALRAQGKLFNGSRNQILKRYTARTDSQYT